ncbi:phosphoribosylaminoimidazole-succinocarboxamide synthase [Aspergillus sclerotioniger CBS 115572]|uniref:Phosphoribosylaminoimidazole-succinocarboxamide synthase n=1 Tax=Aspergillus sclerotioniger CBS 115572 TaxID=1450535 RepID=A0A317V5F7_9EURO|nr:phosphoribosylaminoimidazole-succinocarboxamide synthase [Aspergillus sclerotioniger CBS 115572]PWY68521.1 phosphoribosylaminoimidazole-succinocarboxamide synthase [Aspergillus sclerotioniger CBS 115572]
MLAPGSGNVSLRTVSSSRPQLMHSQSQQSVAASDDYYSFSSPSSSARSRASGSRITVARYATPNSHPPTRTPSPSVSRTHLAPPPGARSEHSLSAPSESRNFATPASRTIRTVDERDTEPSHMSDTTSRREPSDSYAGRPTTPGLDDSPYIHFAISQLTRDEEVAGPRRRSSVTSNDNPLEPLLWDEGLGCFIRSPGPSTTPVRPPQQSSDSIGRAAQSSVDPESFVAVEPPEDSLLYPPLDYVPVVLRTWALAAIILCCLLMIAGISFCNVWSQRHPGLWDYTGLGGSHYFVMQFLPQILGMIITIWTFVIQAALYRTMPFAIMASERPFGYVLQNLPILSQNFLIPDFSHFRHGEAIVGFSLFTMWLSNVITLPLLSCLFQAKWYSIDGEGTWRWASVLEVGWTLVAIYALLAIGLILLMFRFVRTWSGLMWDPVSLADLISIIQRSNILHDFEQSETLPDVGESLDPRLLRLGYWKLSSRAETFYGIGEVDAPVRTPSLHRKEKNLQMQSHGLSRVSFDLEQHDLTEKEEYYQHLYSPAIRYRWVPWFLRDGFVILWTVIVGALFIAFVLVSFIHDAIKGGFPPRLPTLPSTGAFSSSNFCYSFVPALIGNIFFLAWQPIDVYFRALQPFATLSSPNGARAEHSLLLSYPSYYPFQVTILALLNKHYKVAWISFMSTISAAIPILAGGVFIALYHPSDDAIRISALMPAFYTMVAFCALYMLSFLCIWPRRCRRLPHEVNTLADQMSFLYQSPLLADKILREPRSKADLVTRLVVAPPGDREHSMYGFGIYVGRDGKEHLGIDRFDRPGRADMLITTGCMR